MMFPRTWNGPEWKPSRTAAKKAKRAKRSALALLEETEKRAVRRRDKFCRFPLCGCRKLRLTTRVEVSHDRHKGMGGDPTGVRSRRELMILLCLHRHQDGVISRHKGTLRTVYLTPAKTCGPVAWWVDLTTLRRQGLSIDLKALLPGGWVEIARETAPQRLELLQSWQHAVLTRLAEMDL